MLDSLPEAGVGELKNAIVEGGQVAIGGSFPSCPSFVLYSRLEPSDSNLLNGWNKTQQTKTEKRKRREWRTKRGGQCGDGSDREELSEQGKGARDGMGWEFGRLNDNAFCLAAGDLNRVISAANREEWRDEGK